jgi:enamine deaminase RidA (YjgF/YER057c/UK114 family)
MKTSRNPTTIHPPLAAYAHQIEVSGEERWLVLSGQVGMRPDGTLPEDPIQQLEIALENIFRNLQAAGMGVQDLVKLTLYLAGEWDTSRRREVMTVKLLGHQPCSTLIYVAGLAAPIYKVEIDAWACRAD